MISATFNLLLIHPLPLLVPSSLFANSGSGVSSGSENWRQNEDERLGVSETDREVGVETDDCTEVTLLCGLCRCAFRDMIFDFARRMWLRMMIEMKGVELMWFDLGRGEKILTMVVI